MRYIERAIYRPLFRSTNGLSVDFQHVKSRFSSTIVMTIISYSQNFEDVMLWRALKHVEKGFYIDLGAQDPVVDSVSLAFHERGWTGIHVEPTPHYAQLLREQRPGDTVIEAAVANADDLLTFFEIPGTGISTGDPEIAEQHRVRGFETREITVPCVRLSSVFKTCAKQVIHWMKVDVEGFEWSALASWGKALSRPWIVVVESTLPMTQIESYRRWEPLLLRRGYQPVYFDGLNRYYVSQEKSELKQAFSAPPNVFDKFSINGTASTAIHHHLKARHAAELVEVTADVQRANSETEHLRQAIAARDASHSEQAHDSLLQVTALNEEIFELLRARAARDEEFAAVSSMISQQKSEFLCQLAAAEQVTATQLLDWQQREELEREMEISTQIIAIHREYREKIEVTKRAAEAFNSGMQKEFAKKLENSRIETDVERQKLVHFRETEGAAIRQALLAREREFGAQMLVLHDQFIKSQSAHEAESADLVMELSRVHAEEIATVHREMADRQKYFQKQIESARRSYDALRHIERGLQAQIDGLHTLKFDLEQTICRLRSRVTIMERSLSWRLMSPFRNAKAYCFPSQALGESASQESAVTPSKSGLSDHASQNARSPSHISISSEDIMQPTVNRVFSTGAFGSSDIAGIMAPDDHEFLQRAYQMVFARNVDAEGGAHYLDQLRNGNSRLFIFSQLRLSAEGVARAAKHPKLDDELAVATNAKAVATSFEELIAHQGFAFIRAAYLTMLGREPDPSGANDCVVQLRRGAAKAEILSRMEKSEERRARILDIEAIVDAIRHHRVSENAPPESQTAPSNGKAAQLADINASVGELMRCGEQEFLRNAFMLLLGRAPDPEAFGTYLDHLSAGVPRLQLLDAIEGSREARNRARFVSTTERAIRQYRITTMPIIGAFASLFMNEVEQRDHTSQALRAIQFDHALSMERFEQIDTQQKETALVSTVCVDHIEKQLAAIDKELAVIKDSFAQRFSQIQEGLSTLQRPTIQQRQQLNFAQEAVSEITAASGVNPAQESDGLASLSAGARDIYVKLKAATARRALADC